jgi:HPt (histidine-containing phosphotransfer) domain-containing protein
MSVSSISSSASQVSAAQLQQQAQQVERSPRERENDGDRDDATKAAASKTNGPTVNANGQTVGGTINVTA